MSQTTELLRVLVIVRQALLAKVLCESLAGENFLAIGSYGSIMDADIAALRPDVILLDLDACERNVAKALRKCREQSPGSRICALVSNVDGPQVRSCFDEHVSGCIVTDMPFEDVLEAVKVIARGDVFIDPRISRQLFFGRPRLSHQDNLTPREEEIARMLTHGLANKQIAHHLHISQSTVKNHISRIFEKLSVSSRTEAAVVAFKTGLV